MNKSWVTLITKEMEEWKVRLKAVEEAELAPAKREVVGYYNYLVRNRR